MQAPGGLFTYPDVTVVCGQPELIQSRPDTLTNPVILVEVLSEATREYDRGQKFALYKEIPTLREYLLIEQTEVLVEAFKLSGAVWESRAHDNLEMSVTLCVLDLKIPLRDIYRLVFT